MRKWKRPKQPAELKNEKAALTKKFKDEVKRTGKTPTCKWPKVMIRGVGKETLPRMMARSTQKHCAYCDDRLGRSSPKTIDHFLPKSEPAFRHLAYKWQNLYPACTACQSLKGVRYDNNAFRPDEPGYEFALFFQYTLEGEIKVIAPDGPLKVRAEATIELFRLRNKELAAERSREFILYLKPRLRPRKRLMPAGEEILLDDRPFRDWYGSGV